jgi:predicted transcriptional regulator of viral defense system
VDVTDSKSETRVLRLQFTGVKDIVQAKDTAREILRGIETQENGDQAADMIESKDKREAERRSNEEALAIYELTDEIPRMHWIAVSHASKAPVWVGVKIIRMRNIELGATQIDVGNQKISIFDRERTIIDAFRYLSKEVAIKALKTAISHNGKNKIHLTKLQKYAKDLRVNIANYLLAINT